MPLTIPFINISNLPANFSGRLTLSTGTPIMPATVSSATSVLFTPYLGASIPLWNGTQWVQTQFTELSNINANSSVGNAGPSATVAASLYDYYVWLVGGTTPTLTRSPAWTPSGGARPSGAGTAQQMTVNGVVTNAVAITNGPAAGFGTYVGTAATDAGTANISWNHGSGASGGVAASLNVWNMYNRVNVVAAVTDTGIPYTYTTFTFRQARGSAGNQINYVSGQIEDGFTAVYDTSGSGNAAGVGIEVGIGVDSTTAQSGNIGGGNTMVAGESFSLITCFSGSMGIGSHFLAALEAGQATATFNVNSAAFLTAQLRM